MAQKRTHPSSPPSQSQIYTSAPIHDRASTFLALFSPTAPSTSLQSDPSIAAADHKILAWRNPSRQKTLPFGSSASARYDAGHDDDGEKGAGVRLGRVLDAQNVVGSVCVGRWWGGTMLGPVRFTWIEQCAAEAIEKWKAEQQDSGRVDEGRESKRIKNGGIDEAAVEARLKEALVLDLKGRDQNIGVLRELLRTKKEKLEGVASPSSSPVKLPEYETMPMARLRALDKARDATLAYVLKQLDKVDQQQKEEDELDAAFEQVAAAEEKKKDEAALQEMLRNEQDEEEEAFEEMDRIAKEMEEEAKTKEAIGQSQSGDGPNTPKRPK